MVYVSYVLHPPFQQRRGRKIHAVGAWSGNPIDNDWSERFRRPPVLPGGPATKTRIHRRLRKVFETDKGKLARTGNSERS